jgi:hypothetical protein
VAHPLQGAPPEVRVALSYRFPTQTTDSCQAVESSQMFGEEEQTSNSALAGVAGCAVDAAQASSWFDALVDGPDVDLAASALAAMDDSYRAPTAIPVTGTPDWYEARHGDFAARYADLGLTPPSYYLDYGGKYCQAFTEDLRPHLSEAGQEWCDETALALQDALECHRAGDPMGFDAAEKNDAAFTKLAFDTHPTAYLQSGLAELPASDLLLIGTTPEVADLAGPGGLVQVADTGARILPMWAESLGVIDADTAAAIDALLVDAHPTIEWVVTTAYEVAAFCAVPFLDVFASVFGDDALVTLLDEARELVQDVASGRSEAAAELLALNGEAP